MITRSLVIFAVFLALAGPQDPGRLAAQKKDLPKTPKEKPAFKQELSLSMLSLEVTALQGLHRFQLTQEQMQSLKKTVSGLNAESREAPAR